MKSDKEQSTTLILKMNDLLFKEILGHIESLSQTSKTHKLRSTAVDQLPGQSDLIMLERASAFNAGIFVYHFANFAL